MPQQLTSNSCNVCKSSVIFQSSVISITRYAWMVAMVSRRFGTFFQFCPQVTSKQRIFTDSECAFICERSEPLCEGYGFDLNGNENEHELHRRNHCSTSLLLV